MASPGSHADSDGAAAVCCMCGDHGLPAELFRCGLCRLRLQHRYCSELYPRAATYRSCNWCLRDEGDPPPVSEAQTTAAGGRRSNRNDSRDDVGCSRSEFAAEPGKPVKKPPKKKSHERTTAQRPPAAAVGRKTRFRVKVRRYKLLAEVIC
ncbi:hypothetical protein ACP70R_026793 [Stipagrostis hirtigluma subsp. patula]